MENISAFLEKFKKLRNPLEKKEAIAGVITKTISFEVTPQDILIKGSIVFVKGNPYLRNEIYQKKALILAGLKENLKGLIIKDIK
jgi:hypothetical protein